MNQLDTLAGIFDRHYDEIYRYIYHHIGHRQAAEDLAGQVFMRLLEQQKPIEHIQPWLFRVARNLIIDDSRRQKHRNHYPLQDTDAASAGVEAKVEQQLWDDELQAALQTLTLKQRHVVILRFIMDMTTPEVACRLGMTKSGVKALQRRGLANLRRALNHTGRKK